MSTSELIANEIAKLKLIKQQKENRELLKNNRIKTKENNSNRKLDTRRKILAGAFILNEIEKPENTELKELFIKGINNFLTRESDIEFINGYLESLINKD